MIVLRAEGLDGGRRLYSDLFGGYNREVLHRRQSNENVTVGLELHFNRLIDVVRPTSRVLYTPATSRYCYQLIR